MRIAGPSKAQCPVDPKYGVWTLYCQSGVTPANQTKERPVHELFAGANWNKSSRCEPRLFSQGKNNPNSQKWAKFMNFSFWPFLWFGFAGATPDVRFSTPLIQSDVLKVPSPPERLIVAQQAGGPARAGGGVIVLCISAHDT